MRLTSNIWDRLATLSPTRDAAVATSGGDDRYLAPPSPPAGQPPLKPLAPHDYAVNADVIGRRFGRFTVLGIPDAPQSPNGASWVCRCDCGAYETRKKKSLKRGDVNHLQCDQCHQAGQTVADTRTPLAASTRASRESDALRLDDLARREREKGAQRAA